MTVQMSSQALRVSTAALAFGLATLGLSACGSPNPVAVQNTTPAAGEPTPSASVPPTAQKVTGVPLELGCDDILPPDDLYGIKGGSNWAFDPDFTAQAGTTAASISELKGVNCGYVNTTSGETFRVSVAEVTPDSVTPLKNHLVTQLSTKAFVPAFSPTKNIEGYFTVSNGLGEAQIATSAYWISIASTTFAEPGEVEQLVAIVEDSLGK